LSGRRDVRPRRLKAAGRVIMGDNHRRGAVRQGIGEYLAGGRASGRSAPPTPPVCSGFRSPH
jgi:hypothetical protein